MADEKKVRKLITAALRQCSEPLALIDLRKSIIADELLVHSHETKNGRKSAFAYSLDKLLEKKRVRLRGDKVMLLEREGCGHAGVDDSKKRKRDDDGYEEDERDTIGHATRVMQGHAEILNKGGEDSAVKSYPPPVVNEADCINSILLFYAYCIPQMSRSEQDNAIAHCYGVLKVNGCSGRLRVAREGFNATLTGSSVGIRAFTADLRVTYPHIFGETDFKYVDKQPSNQLLKGLKVWPVTEIVTYGFDPKDAPLGNPINSNHNYHQYYHHTALSTRTHIDMRGTHLKPVEFHEALADPNSVVIDVRNFNETLIGKFAPPTVDGVAMEEKVLDPCMRKSTGESIPYFTSSSEIRNPSYSCDYLYAEFPKWVDDNKFRLEGKQVLMYCTGGVRCERASAFMRNRGVENVFQLEGGIHRYLEEFPEDGGYWIGKNYTFDKRFSHGARSAETISSCVLCENPWDRYQAQKACYGCKMEVLLCKDCQKVKPKKEQLKCPLCK